MYSKVEIYGNCDVNYLNVKKGVDSSADILSVVKAGLTKPQWVKDTIMLASYEPNSAGELSIDGTPLDIVNGKVVGYQIQKYNVNTNTMSYVAQTTQTKLQDYVVNNNVQYQYYIFPIIESESGRLLGSPIVTDAITPAWDMCTIIGLIETDKKNEYTVDPNNIWRLHLNVEREDYVLNMDKTFTDGFDRFPKRTQGRKKYITSGVNSIIGTLQCNGDKVDIGIKDIERWEDFCYSPNLKLFNDMHGRIIPIDIKTMSAKYLGNFANAPLVTQISFVQLADVNDITVYGTDGE